MIWKATQAMIILTLHQSYRHYPTGRDTPDKVDYEALARVTAGPGDKDSVPAAARRQSMNIEDYSFGHIRIDGKEYTSDLIIYPDRIDADWWRKEGHRLAAVDLPDVLSSPPEVLVIGTGNAGRMTVPEETLKALGEAGIAVRLARTGEAVELFNNLHDKGGRVVAALHLTC